MANNVVYRIISALILIPIVLSVTCIGNLPFLAMLFFVVIIMSFEWQRMIPGRESKIWKWKFMGVVYIMLPVISFLWLRNHNNFGVIGSIWLLITVWGADSAAFFFGKLIGGAKLSKISPNKTWAGFVGALVGGTVCGVLVLRYFSIAVGLDKIVYSFLIAFLSQCGDLFESAIKRRLQIKDTGSIIPGHGGILDRLDSMIFSAVFVVLIVSFNLW